MAQPANRQEFIEYCLRQLGKPIIRVEVTREQADDAVDNALTLWRENHYDGTLRTYLKHQITTQDMVNHYIPCNDSVMSVVRCSQFSEANLNIFDVRYQLRLQ